MPSTKTFSIRIAQPTDADAISSLLAACYSRILAACYDNDVLIRALPHFTKANPTLLVCGTYYVAESEAGGIVGCGGWTPEQPLTKDIVQGEAHVRHFATDPTEIRQGIGGTLLAHCINEARRNSVHTLHCYSTFYAEPFYQAAGFKTIKSIEFALSPGVTLPSLWMMRKLGEASQEAPEKGSVNNS
jgi:N-acetylglutamate synthase-like GNAT family acetyltransferase